MNKFSDYEKIMQVLDAKGINQTEGERLTRFGVGTIGKLLTRRKGKGRLHPDNVTKFLRTFHVEQKWWETGEGEMFTAESGRSLGQQKTMDLDVWEVIKGSNKIHEESHNIFKLEFERLWGLIEKFGPSPPPPLNKEPVQKNGN